MPNKSVFGEQAAVTNDNKRRLSNLETQEHGGTAAPFGGVEYTGTPGAGFITYWTGDGTVTAASFGTADVATLTGAQTLTNKTLTTPTIGNFTNAQHNHTSASTGGVVTVGTANVGSAIHGATLKNTPTPFDEIAVLDQADLFTLKRTTIGLLIPILATTTPTAGSIAKGDGSGKLDSWISNAGAATLGKAAFPAADFNVTDGTVSLGTTVVRYSGVPGAGTIAYWTGAGTVAAAPFGTADVVTLAATQTLTAKTLTAPTIGDFTNATHDHGDADDGGTLANDIVTNSILANMAEATVKGRQAGGGTGDPEDLTATQVRTILNVEDGADVTDAGNVGSTIHGASAKTTPVDADTVPLIDSEASNVLKKLSWANIKATLKSYLDTLYVALTGDQTVAGVKTFSSAVTGTAGFDLTVDGTNGMIKRSTTATGGSLRTMLDLRITSTGSVSDGFGPALFYSMNDAETGAVDNFLASLGAARDGADNNGKIVARVYVAGVSTVAGEIGSSLNWAVGTTVQDARLFVLQNTLGGEVFSLSSTATNDDPREWVIQGRAATTNATPATLATIPIAASNTYLIHAHVIARRTGGVAGTADDGAAYSLKSAYTTKTGTVTLLGGSALEAVVKEDVGAYDAALVISGTDVIVQVTGVANTNITWHATVRVSRVGS